VNRPSSTSVIAATAITGSVIPIAFFPSLFSAANLN
jgi:hypothetical protein